MKIIEVYEADSLKIIKLETSELVVNSLSWSQGSPYDPPGYYFTYTLNGETFQRLLHPDIHEPTEAEE